MERKTQINIVWGKINPDGFYEHQYAYHGNDIPCIGSHFSCCERVIDSDGKFQVVYKLDGKVKDVKYHYKTLSNADGREIRASMCISVLIRLRSQWDKTFGIDEDTRTQIISEIAKVIIERTGTSRPLLGIFADGWEKHEDLTGITSKILEEMGLELSEGIIEAIWKYMVELVAEDFGSRRCSV